MSADFLFELPVWNPHIETSVPGRAFREETPSTEDQGDARKTISSWIKGARPGTI